MSDLGDQVTKPAPCLICGKELDPIQPGDVQPVDALMLCGSGQYGSAFDPMDGSELLVSVCDPCLYKNADRILHMRTTRPVLRDVRPWNPEENL